MGSGCKDGRRNARVENQRWTLMTYIDNISVEKYLAHQASKVKNSVYGFSGSSKICNVRIDFRKDSNATIIADFFEILDEIADESVDLFMVDPIFYCYNPGSNVWKYMIKKGIMPKSSAKTRFFGHPHLWQKVVYQKVKPGGVMISKRSIMNTQVLSKFPQLFYVHDTRPMAHIVRIDHK